MTAVRAEPRPRTVGRREERGATESDDRSEERQQRRKGGNIETLRPGYRAEHNDCCYEHRQHGSAQRGSLGFGRRVADTDPGVPKISVTIPRRVRAIDG